MRQKDNHQSTAEQSVSRESVTVYFRCSNKITYPIKLGSHINLPQLKTTIAKEQKMCEEDLRFIYQGKQLLDIEDLKPRHLKCIVHVVNKAKIHQENLMLTINFANKMKQDYQVTKDMKIQELIHLIKSKHQLNKVVLIHLGTVLKPQRTFQQLMIEDRSVIYVPQTKSEQLVDGSKRTSKNENIKPSVQNLPNTKANNLESSSSIINSTKLFGSYPPQGQQLKKEKKIQSKALLSLSQQLDITETEKEEQIPSQNKEKKKFNEINIPVSDVFDVHKHPDLLQKHEGIFEQRKNTATFLKPDLPRYQFLRSSAARSESMMFSKNDFIFSGEEELLQTQQILAKFLHEMRPKHSKKG